MKWRAVRADARYLITHWMRSGQAVVISLIVPLILLGAFGFLFQGAAAEPPLLHVEDQAGTEGSRALLDRLGSDGLVRVQSGPVPSGQLDRWMQAEGIAGVLVITSAYTAEEPANRTGALRLSVGEGGFEARIVRAAVERAVAEGQARGDDGTAASAIVALDERAVPVQSGYRSFLLPGILGLSVALSGIAAGYSSMTELRHMGLLQRLAASPLRKSEWLLGRMLGSVVIGLVAATVLVVAAWFLDPGTFHIGIWTVVLVIAGTLVFAGLGTLLGLVVERPEVGTALLNLALLPLVLLSGTFFSLDRLPAGVRWLSVFSPLTHLTVGLRADMLTGPAGGAGESAALVLGMALVVLVVGARLIRWTERS